MKKKSTGTKVFTGVMGTAALLSACAPATNVNAPKAVQEYALAETGAQDTLAGIDAQLQDRESETYQKVANVQGEFNFDQNVVTPPDELFSLFGTAATYVCAKPGFAFGEVSREEYYINVSGDIQKYFTIGMDEIQKRQASERNMVCTCATGGTIAQSRVRGVDVNDIIAIADLDEGVNTVRFKGEGGYGLPLPLSYVQDKGAMLVYQIGGKDLPASQGAPVQVWMPETVAKYFTRRVTEIEFTREETAPQVIGVEEEFRAKVGIVNRFQESFRIGDRIRFEGYADDCGVAIEAVEFSMDGGETWTSCATENTASDLWVYWYFSYTAEEAGTFKLDARARTADGFVSPLYSSLVFTVTDGVEKV